MTAAGHSTYVAEPDQAPSVAEHDVGDIPWQLAAAAAHVRDIPNHIAAQDEVFVALQKLQCDIETALDAAQHQRQLVVVPATGPPPPQWQERLPPTSCGPTTGWTRGRT